MTQQVPVPGWYPDPVNPGKQIYWDGTAWTGPLSPASTPDESSKGKATAVSIGVCVLVGIGLVMSMQSVSLLSGSGAVWTGVAVVAGGTAVAFFLGAAKWVKVLAVLFLVIAVANGFYIEKQMSDKREELTHLFKP